MIQSKNAVYVEGILSENNLEDATYRRKSDGVEVECIRGSIKIKTAELINNEPTDLEVEIPFFSNKYKPDGSTNKQYQSIKELKDNYVSIAAAGNENDADRIRITLANIEENAYYSERNQKVSSYPRLRGVFFRKVAKNDCKPEARFDVRMVILQKGYELDSDGIETDKYIVKGALVQFGDRVDIVDFAVYNQAAIESISTYWEIGDTVDARGKLNFSSKTEKIVEEQGFGEPIEKTRTIRVSELIITGGSQMGIDGEAAYDIAEIKKGLSERDARLEAMKVSTPAPAPAQETKAVNAFDDLGF